MGLGLSFQPSSNPNEPTGGSPPAFGSQGTIKTLNYQLPAQAGAAGAAAISPLVSDTRQASGISSAVLESVLRTVLGPDHASMILNPAPAPQANVGGGSAGGDTGMAAIMAAVSGGGGPDASRADNGSQDYAPPSAPAPSIHPGDAFNPPPVVTNTLGEAPGFKQDVTPSVTPTPGSFRDSLDAENAMNGRGVGTPDFGGGGRDWLTGRNG